MKIHFNKLKPVLFAIALAFVMLLGPIVTVRADAAILLRGFDVPALVPFDNDVIYWPIGVTFDGQNLWYSQPSNHTADIFLTTTTGHLLRTLSVVNQAGALAWDGNYLWVAIAANGPNSSTCVSGVNGCALLYQVDVHRNQVVKTLDISQIFATDQECNFIDGLSYDSSTNTLWVSPDIGCAFAFADNPCSIGFVYQITTSGQLLKRIQEPFAVAGVANSGNRLYMVSCSLPGAHGQRPVFTTRLDGSVVANFTTVSVSGQHESAESLVFDSQTFQNACALWVMQDYGFPFDASLAAYKIRCPQNTQ